MSGRTLQYYQDNAASLIPRYESAEMGDLHAQLVGAFEPGGRLLELGGGSGRDASFMAEHGFDVTLSDGSEAMLSLATETHPGLVGHTLRYCCPEPLPFADGSLDGVFAVAVLMHLPREAIEASIAQVARVLRVEGGFFFSVPFQRDDVRVADRDDKGRLFTSLSPDGWETLGKGAGLEIVASQQNEDGLGREGIRWVSMVMKKTVPPKDAL